MSEEIRALLETERPEQSYSWDDKGFSALFSEVFRDVLRFNATAKAWFFFDGKKWRLDQGGMQAQRLAKTFADELFNYCGSIADERTKTLFTKRVLRYGELRHRETLLKDARDANYITQNDLDNNRALFNCQNGTYNLNTGEFSPHHASDLLSKVSNVVYDPEARSPLFERFLNEIMEGNKEKIFYLQRLFGYALTADTSLETCWIFYGRTTRNGKSTLVETIAHMMGNNDGYALSMQPQTLAQRQNKDTRQASGDIARLDGCRFVNASEPPKRMLFDTALLKTMLGRDTIVARHLYEREYEFVPRFKLFINTNFLPVITDDSLFSSGRINVVEFPRHFSPTEQDPGLKQELQKPENVSGIFNWCLEGLKHFREIGADAPEAVREATAEYRRISDKIGLFVAECLQKSQGNSGAGEVYQRYSTWCENNGYGTESKGNFFDDLKSKGLFALSGTVDGRTVRNVVKGYEIA